jgi:hypothetical protein
VADVVCWKYQPTLRNSMSVEREMVLPIVFAPRD